MTKHTEGEWIADAHHTADYAGRTHGYVRATGHLVPLAAVVLGVEGMPQDEGRANLRLMAASKCMLKALQDIVAGSNHTGRWLDPNGSECGEEDEGARWEEFDEDEQRAWLETVARLASEAIAAATGAPTGEPATPTACDNDGPYPPELAEAFRIGARELCNSALGDRISVDADARVEECEPGDGGAIVHCTIYVSDGERAALAGQEGEG